MIQAGKQDLQDMSNVNWHNSGNPVWPPVDSGRICKVRKSVIYTVIEIYLIGKAKINKKQFLSMYKLFLQRPA